MTDLELLEQIGTLQSIIDTAEREQAELKAQLLKSQKETGEISISDGKWESLMKKAPISLAWLKREFGYEPNDLPDGIIKEKIVADLDTAALVAWLEQDGSKVQQPYTIQIKRVKGK